MVTRLKVIIPAAGLGKRFVAAGVHTPKELLPLGEKPVIAHALAEATRAGFDSAFVVVSSVKESLRLYLAETQQPLPVEIVIQPKPLGIGDAVLRCWEGEPVAVLLPDDVVLETNHWPHLIELNRQSGAATLCVRTVPTAETDRFGMAECEGDRVVRLVEKPPIGTVSSNLAIFGRYVVTTDVVAGLKAAGSFPELELTYGFASAVNTVAGVRAVRFHSQIFDCGTPAEYASSVARFAELQQAQGR
jgi:UTP-glucose-1-phosphate uridylyltransferase